MSKEYLVISGVQENGKKFRPSDWVERLSSTLASFHIDNRLRYSPGVQPCMIEGEYCLVVARWLETADPAAYAYVKSELSIAQQTLNALDLKAPKDGLVLYRRDRKREPQVGDENQAGQVVVELVDLNALQARMYVLERDAGSLAKEKEVVIKLGSIPEKFFKGSVRSITVLAQPLERNSPLKYFTCEVTIRDAGQDLRRIKPGMALKAMVVLEKYDSCFVVPASAVTSKGTEDLVYIKQGNKFVARAVKLGASGHGQATILEGVKEKELVAMRNPFESRKARLPDFSKGTTGQPQFRMRFEMH